MSTTDKSESPHNSSGTRVNPIRLRTVAGLFVLLLVATASFAQSNQDGERTEGLIRFGFDAQDYNSGQTSRVGSIDATIRLLPRLTLETVATGGTYFGDGFGGGGAYVTMQPDAKTYLTIGGSRNSITRTTVVWSGFFGAGRAVYESPRGMIRGVEAGFNLTERGYALSPSTRILQLDPNVILYLPRDWTLTLRAGAIRTSVGGANLWSPSGGAKLTVPLTRRLSISPTVAFDSELMDVLQINNVHSRQFGAGSRFWLTKRTTVDVYYFRALFGANHLASSVYGVSYALRF
ncbi:MAG TPA: hypothetical protein VGT24_09310 [Candidatus Acidoferrales bacterium]|nr:hypothetical protein [Candidatus Acidoferrales bacterium]